MNTVEHPPRKARRATLIVVGSCLVLLALAPIIGGAVLLHKHATSTDADGFYASGYTPLHGSTAAFVAEKLDVGTDLPDVLFRKGRLGTLCITATGTPDKPVFVGIAPQPQARDYLRRVAYDEIDDFEISPFSVTTHRYEGRDRAPRPAAESIWAASAMGAGRQRVQWRVQKGDWAVVVMNADGSPGVATKVSIAARLPFLLWLAAGLLALGGIAALGGGALVYAGARNRSASTLKASPVAAQAAGS